MDNYARYIGEIEAYERESEKWTERSKKIVKLYKDADNPSGKKKRFNVLWSNVETLRPALYARDPKPEVDRRNKDANALARTSSEVLQRCISYAVACNGFSDAMANSVKDRLLPGRGVQWHRYVPVIEGEALTYEKVAVDYVYWEDFGHNIARTWAEVTLVWRKVYMTREQLKTRFPDKGASVPLDHSPKNLKDEKVNEEVKKACIYEIWDKDLKCVGFLSKSMEGMIEKAPDPLELTEFFPCQKPLFATVTTDSLIPTPDYVLYQTQAIELEELTARIDSLQKALRVIGVYDTSAPALANLLNGSENKMIPVERWAAFAEKGGLEGAVDFLPIKEIGEVLLGLYESRDKVKEDLYEITGLSDIIRGNSEPNETAKAQQIKGRFAVLRISDSQTDVQRFARDSIRIQAEIIAENFSLETIKAISGVNLMTNQEKQMAQMVMQQQAQYQQAVQAAKQQGQQPPPPPQTPPLPPNAEQMMKLPSWEEVHGLLSNDVLREFLVDIETDSMIRTDEDADKQSRNEFLASAGGYLKQVAEAVMVTPAIAPLAGELLMFAVRGHRVGRVVEPMFEEAMAKLQQQAQQPKSDPEMEKAKAQMQMEQQKFQAQAQLEQQKMQMNMQLEQAKQNAQSQQEAEKTAFEVERGKIELQQTAEIERFKANLTMQLETHKANLQAQLEREKMAMEQDTALKVEAIKSEASKDIESHKAETTKSVEEEKGRIAVKTQAQKDGKKVRDDGGIEDPQLELLSKAVAELKEQVSKPRTYKVKRDADGLISELH
jgi:hypothetical protein